MAWTISICRLSWTLISVIICVVVQILIVLTPQQSALIVQALDDYMLDTVSLAPVVQAIDVWTTSTNRPRDGRQCITSANFKIHVLLLFSKISKIIIILEKKTSL
jgi:hypothetical protein